MTTTDAAPTFEQPGPGGWKRLGDHFPGALTPEYQRIYAATCPVGMATFMANYGVLARTLDIAYVHGHLYVTPSPVAGPRESKRPPPRAAVWLLSRLHPEFRRRTRAARRALEERPWRAVQQHWFETERDQWRDRNRAVQDIDPRSLDDPGLVAHLVACRDLVDEGYLRHFELHGDDLLPIGLLLTRCAEWGIDVGDAARTLHGTPHPLGTQVPEDWMLITGYDLDARAWTEVGAPSMASLGAQPAPYDLTDRIEHDAQRAELAELLHDARAAVPLRDDNGMLTGAWPMGLLRRAMLAAGARLDLGNDALAVEYTVDELIAAIRGEREIRAVDAQERALDRARRSALPAPDVLGPEFAIPPLDALPRPLARIGAAQLSAADQVFGTEHAVGIGDRAYTGRALVVDDPAVALALIEPGDVLITTATSPAWNVVLFEAGAIVTTHGGLVSHAAVIARELDVPAVIGDRGVVSRFRTGDQVVVDPVSARVALATTDRSVATS